jgi:hypothetical protein
VAKSERQFDRAVFEQVGNQPAFKPAEIDPPGL